MGLPKEMLGQFASPEVQIKAQATRAANRKKKEEARKLLQEDAFLGSKVASAANQRKILDNLMTIAMDPSHKMFQWANDMLIKNKLMDFATSAVKSDAEKDSGDPEEAKKKLVKLMRKGDQDG